ncbi:Uncharacterized protein THER_0291 [Thermodesulfovibrio sp. N1]|uniref:TIGR04013 family B12-binding domain/radical SAM domain-containing protein n=1 Tax=Thermodesulfovibrio sp. N1 TaxID=1871110 RepID=UPI00083A24ED|nr:TIGR04013 family B12-binding domain/radical SAM domain-containing protein [Thermodesulfovibrio sp. N1]ODA44926.1 Uncharacterized protein THER_0291 [Thermodesulfovibrio sp. N1]
MKIFFYETKFNRYSITVLIASLEHAGLIDKIEIEIFKDTDIENILNKEIKGIFCFSFCSPQWEKIKEILEKIKSVSPNSLFLAGGPHPSGAPKETLQAGFDYVFVGEGEKNFPELIEKIMHGKVFPNIIHGEKVDIDNYPAWSLKHKKFSPLEITRGCPYACKFCQTSYLFGTKPRHRNIESILKHVEIFIKQGMRDLRFITPNALSYASKDGKTLNLVAVEELLKSIKSLSKDIRIFFGTFPSEVRPEHVTPEALEVIKPYISNKTLTIGAQSGSDRILDKIHRGHSVEDVYNAVNNAINAGFFVNVDFIFGLPGETASDQADTIKLMETLINLGHKKNIEVKIHSHYFIPLSGTPFAKEKPIKLSRNLTQFMGKLYNLKNIFGKWYEQKLYSEY